MVGKGCKLPKSSQLWLIRSKRYALPRMNWLDGQGFRKWRWRPMSDTAKAMLLFTLILFCSAGAKAQEKTPVQGSTQTRFFSADLKVIATSDLRDLNLLKTIRPPELKDFLSGELPTDYVVVSDFRQYSPGDGIPVSLPTSAAVTYDGQNLYIVFICQDDPQKVRGRMSKREDFSDDDSLYVYIDTFHDGQSAYYFSANPLGIQADGIATQDGEIDERFDAIWDCEGQITEFGYVVLFTIPFKSLRFSKDLEQKWGVALGRKIERSNESAFWPFITSRQSSFLQQLSTIKLDGVSPGRNIQVIPYATFTNAKLLDDSGQRYNYENEFRGGIDAKMVLRNALTMDLTINPDYSQVETDDPQVTINKRFEVFFPEKRPFFLENINYFKTPLQLFYSRRIADPDFGIRMTGKIDRWNIGLLGIDDSGPGKRVDEDSPLYDENALNGTARIQRELGRDSNVGVLVTGRSLEDTNNVVFSTDTRLALTSNWNFEGQLAYSKDVNYDDQDRLETETGQAYYAQIGYSGRHFGYALDYTDISSDFKAPLGFIERKDIREVSQYTSYYFKPEGSKLQSFGPSLTVGMNWDQSGKLQDRFSYVDFQMDFAGPFGFNIARYDAYERFLSREFTYGNTEVSFYAGWIKEFTFNGSVTIGNGVNYSTPEGVDPFEGDDLALALGFKWRPGSRMSLGSSYNYNHFRAPRGFEGAGGKGREVFTNQFNRTKFNFQFTKALSLRLIVDYYFLSCNPELFEGEKIEQLEGDVLLTYFLNPGTALYIGYNSGFENFDEDQDGSGLRRSGSPTYLTKSQFFVKLSYLFRF